MRQLFGFIFDFSLFCYWGLNMKKFVIFIFIDIISWYFIIVANNLMSNFSIDLFASTNFCIWKVRNCYFFTCEHLNSIVIDLIILMYCKLLKFLKNFWNDKNVGESWLLTFLCLFLNNLWEIKMIHIWDVLQRFKLYNQW